MKPQTSNVLLTLLTGILTATTTVSRAEAPATAAATPSPTPLETTPVTLPGAETFVYRDGQPDPMRLHVFKPEGWSASGKLGAVVWFFGGGWSKGTPEKSAGWARNAAQWGLVGIAPDYRTKNRFGTTPLESVADSRAAVRWVQDHAAELGIDPAKIVVGGNSAGGHVALWTGIEHAPPGSNPKESPTVKPAALILLCAASDTSTESGYTPKRFGANAEALSGLHQLDPNMPPMLVFHGDADATVPYRQSVDLVKKLTDSGNSAELVTVPGGSHRFVSETPGWKEKTKSMIKDFLTKQNLISSP